MKEGPLLTLRLSTGFEDLLLACYGLSLEWDTGMDKRDTSKSLHLQWGFLSTLSGMGIPRARFVSRLET